MTKKQKNLNIKWKQGTQSRASAADVYSFFESVREKNSGELDIDFAVEASRDKKSPLHNELEWDDKKAGHEYRKNQIRYYVRSIEVVRDDIIHPVRAYESIQVERIVEPDDKNRQKHRSVFRSTEEILSDEDGRAQLLTRAIRDAVSFKRRYAALSELSKIITVIDSEVEKIKDEIAI